MQKLCQKTPIVPSIYETGVSGRIKFSKMEGQIIMGEKQGTIEQYRMAWRHLSWFLLLVLMVAVTGCGTVQHKVEFNDSAVSL